MDNKKENNFLSFGLIIISVLVVAFLGSLFTNIGMDWFNSLNRPSQFAPKILFPIVWSMIYLSFIVILCIWEYQDKIPAKTIVLLIINGALNVLWCLVFFTLKQTFLGQVIILLNLVAAILLWIDIFYEKKVFSYILSVYPLWLLLATCLNLSIWILN